MEETISYEAFFSADEWDSLQFGEWTDIDGSLDGSPSGVTLNDQGSAAPSQAVASEGIPPSENGPSAASSDGNGKKSHHVAGIDLGIVHEVTCRTRELIEGTTQYVLECEICEEIGIADTYEEADAIAQLHRTLVAELVEP